MATKKSETKENLNTGMAVVAYILFFIPLLTEDKNDPYVKFHTKQGLTLFVAWVIIMIFSQVPILGWLLALPLNLAMLVLMVMGIINAVNGEKKELPLIGQYADRFKI